MESNDDQITIIELDPTELYQQDKAQIDIGIATAKKYPRNVKRSMENAITIATIDKETAKTCNYALPRAGKTITGPSVHLATIVFQEWGNMRAESKVVNIDSKHVTSQATAFDLEKNIAIRVEVKRSIVTKNGRMSDDMITVTGNAGNSIAFRNAVLKVIPRQVVDKVYKAALDKITGDVSDATKLLNLRKEVFDKLRDDYTVTEREILDTIGKASISNITQTDLVTIIGLGQAIKDGDTTIEEAFRSKRTPGAPSPEKETERNERNEAKFKQIEGLLVEVLPQLTEAEQKSISAIVKQKRAQSYDKTIKFLESKKTPAAK
jgi:hypothetical protein